ncbi:MAG: hypothetical protein E7560_04970 [Ruminococcaceae bacterium]|nr:hypothetical protein [Oscillospiraceae bacterium]
MDDLSSKLSELLNDPESMERMRKMAENLLGEQPKSEENANPNTNFSDAFGNIDIGSLISIINRLKNSRENPRTNLLSALKPHLSEPRQEKVDTAIKILKVIEILPLIKDSGILNF